MFKLSTLNFIGIVGGNINALLIGEFVYHYLRNFAGIPTVKRDKQSYLMTTLQNLIEAMSESEANDSILIVFVAETDLDYVLLVAKQIELRFPKQVTKYINFVSNILSFDQSPKYCNFIKFIN